MGFRKWKLPQADPERIKNLIQQTGIPEIAAQILDGRGVQDVSAYTAGAEGKMHDPFLMADMDFTRKFNLGDQRDLEIKAILSTVYQAIQEKGYNPINQIVGYILSEDPTYITNHNNARALIRRVDRDELLQTLVKYYLTH